MRARFFTASGDKYETTKKIKVKVHNRDNKGADTRESITPAKRARLVTGNTTSVGCEAIRKLIKEEMKKEFHSCKRQHSVMNHNDFQSVSEVRMTEHSHESGGKKILPF